MKARPSDRSLVLIVAGTAATVLQSFVAVHLATQTSAFPNDSAEVQQEPPEESFSSSIAGAVRDFTHGDLHDDQRLADNQLRLAKSGTPTCGAPQIPAYMATAPSDETAAAVAQTLSGELFRFV